MDTGLWNVKILARRYGQTERTIREWAKQGIIPGFKRPQSKEWFFDPVEILNTERRWKRNTRREYALARV